MSTSSQVTVGKNIFGSRALTTHGRLLKEDVVDGEQQLRRAYCERDFFCRCHTNHLLSKEKKSTIDHVEVIVHYIKLNGKKNFPAAIFYC